MSAATLRPGQAAAGGTPAITVVLPVRNGEPFVRAALDSLLNQSCANFEVLVLDDGSTDRTVSIARAIGDQRIRVVSDGQSRGLAARLNQGVALATGDYIARTDADDVSFPLRLERQQGFLMAHPDVDLVGCRAIVFRAEGEVLGLLPFAATHEALCSRPWHNIPLPHPAWFGRREWFLRNPYRDPEVLRAEDQELLLRASRTSRFACLPDVLIGYRQSQFDFGRTWLARRSLLAAQVDIFRRRGEWKHVALACAATGVKLVRDLAAVLPGAEGLRDLALRAHVDPSVQQDLLSTLRWQPESVNESSS